MQSRGRYLGIIVCLVSLVVLIGCAGDRTTRSTGEALDDAAVASKVKTALLADKDVSGLQVEVEVFRGNVQLSGFVDRASQVQKAGQIARGINGVHSVRNNLALK